MKKKIIFWTKGLDDLLNDQSRFNGGAAVQMVFWAKTFEENNWEVYSFSERKNSIINGIKFIKFPSINKLGVFLELFLSLFFILKISPDVIIRRGASRNLFFTAFSAWILCKKLIFMGAHDTDFVPGNEIIDSKLNKILYQIGVSFTNLFIVQNTNQSESLFRNYKKNDYLLIPNIWKKKLSKSKKITLSKKYFLWVSNFNARKRPKWFIQLAKENPLKEFVMVGGPGNLALFNKCQLDSHKIKNLLFYGPKRFSFTNSLFSEAQIFYCTSESEGFPNTILQAWSNNVPVISTFDPSNIIKSKNLGIIVSSEEELKKATENLLTNLELYNNIQINIKNYFKQTHDSQSAYEKLITHYKL